jgi:hypothetical protein
LNYKRGSSQHGSPDVLWNGVEMMMMLFDVCLCICDTHSLTAHNLVVGLPLSTTYDYSYVLLAPITFRLD